jgi:ketosteroid isomerase-like protein
MSPRWFLAAALALGCASPPPRTEPSIDPGRLPQSFEAQFARSADAWNRGDLDAFMADYAPDTLPTFVSGGHLVRGFDRIRQNYAPRFAPGAQRDSLRFEEFNVRPLTADFVLITARYILYRGGITTASGPFTVLMQHLPEGWKIIHDHTSND